MLLLFLLVTAAWAQECHPKCSWQCDAPKCPAICMPICEPPACHTSCTPPTSALCDVKCAKPQCQIKCPEEPCTSDDCPKCYTDCEAPECVTHCKAPPPECQVVCSDLACSWQCHKPQCPKPKCELMCENPHCAPELECCKCHEDSIPLTQEVRTLFSANEPDANCCSCGNHQAIVGSSSGPKYKKTSDTDTPPEELSHEGLLEELIAKNKH